MVASFNVKLPCHLIVVSCKVQIVSVFWIPTKLSLSGVGSIARYSINYISSIRRIYPSFSFLGNNLLILSPVVISWKGFFERYCRLSKEERGYKWLLLQPCCEASCWPLWVFKSQRSTSAKHQDQYLIPSGNPLDNLFCFKFNW
jgi:hypothetical protein